MRRAAKIDGNHGAIVDALRAIGCSVQSLAAVGGGVPDLLVGRVVPGGGAMTYLLEVKDGSLPPSARRLTPAQLEWHGAWRGGPLAVVCDVESAIRAVSFGGGWT